MKENIWPLIRGGTAKGDLFFIVDGDDYLTEDATLKSLVLWDCKNKSNFAGISFVVESIQANILVHKIFWAL